MYKRLGSVAATVLVASVLAGPSWAYRPQIVVDPAPSDRPKPPVELSVVETDTVRVMYEIKASEQLQDLAAVHLFIFDEAGAILLFVPLHEVPLVMDEQGRFVRSESESNEEVVFRGSFQIAPVVQAVNEASGSEKVDPEATVM